MQATIQVHGGGPLPNVNGFHYFPVAIGWGQRQYPGGVPVHTVVYLPRMYCHPILVIESFHCILVFRYSLQCPARLSHVHCFTVSAGDLICNIPLTKVLGSNVWTSLEFPNACYVRAQQSSLTFNDVAMSLYSFILLNALKFAERLLSQCA